MKRLLVLFLSTIVVAAVVGCSPGPDEPATVAPDTRDGPTVRVGSLLDSEGSILGSMVIQMLEANGVKTEDRTKLGTPDTVRAALLAGDIDATVDYTGSGQFFHEGQEGDPKWKNAEQAYDAIRKLDKDVNGLDWLTPAPANNSEFIATTKEFAAANHLSTMQDFAAYVNAGDPVKVIASESWIVNPLGLIGFEQAYGFSLGDAQLVSLPHGNTAEMLTALAKGTDGINFSLAYGTDGQLADLDLVILTDTEDVPPVYQPAPVFHEEIIAAYPDIPEILEPVFLSLDQTKLQALNARVAFDGEDPKAVATSYLTENGFLQ